MDNDWLEKKLEEDAKKYPDLMKMLRECTAHKPLLLYVPPGKTVTIECPVHPDGHDIVGSGPVW